MKAGMKGAKQKAIENKPDTRGAVNTMQSHNAVMGRMKKVAPAPVNAKGKGR